LQFVRPVGTGPGPPSSGRAVDRSRGRPAVAEPAMEARRAGLAPSCARRAGRGAAV